MTLFVVLHPEYLWKANQGGDKIMPIVSTLSFLGLLHLQAPMEQLSTDSFANHDAYFSPVDR